MFIIIMYIYVYVFLVLIWRIIAPYMQYSLVKTKLQILK